MRALLDLPKPNGDVASLRNFHDSLESYVRGLDTLGKTEDMYGDLLVPIVLEKLPGLTRKQIAREHGSTEWTLKELRKAILKEIEVVEVGDISCTPSLSTLTTFNQPSVTAVFLTDTKQPRSKSCVFCKGTHGSMDCKVVMDHAARLAITKRDRLCFNCLGTHRIKDCRSKYTCRLCKRRHHTSLCMGSYSQGSTSAENKMDQKPTQVHAKSVSAGDVNSNQWLKTGAVLLKTAVTDISAGSQTYTATILFDEGATHSFVTKDLTQKLNVTCDGSQMIQLAAFGGKSSQVRNYDNVSLAVHTLSGEKKGISALVVPKISAPVKNFVNSSRLDLPHLKGLNFAHPVSNADSFEISVLIGADFYWDFVKDSVIRGPGPTAVQSELGYLLSGPMYAENANVNQAIHVATDSIEEEGKLQDYWNLETLWIKADTHESVTSSDFETYRDAHLRLENDRYIAKLPWVSDHF